MAQTTLETLKKIRYADSLSGWSTETDSTLGRNSIGLKDHGFASNLNKVLEKNNVYIQSGNVGSDIQYYYDTYGNSAGIEDFVTQYNNNIDTLNNQWKTSPLNYTSTGWSDHNQLFSRMYHSRSNPEGDNTNGNIGYDPSLEDLLGSNTWLRNADIYEGDWDSLDESAKASRTHTITLSDGTKAKVGKQWDGKLVLIPDSPEPNPIETPGPDPIKPNPLPTWSPKDVTYKDISKPEKNFDFWSDWLSLTKQALNSTTDAINRWHNNTKKTVALDQADYQIHKDTSNYAQRQQLENTKNQMISASANAAAQVNDPTVRQNIIQQGYEQSSKIADTQNEYYTVAHNWNIQDGTEKANYNNFQDTTVGNTNRGRLHSLRDFFINNNNALSAEKTAIANDYTQAMDASINAVVKTNRQNDQWALEQNLYNTKNRLATQLGEEYRKAYNDLTYNSSAVGNALWNIAHGKYSNNETIAMKYYRDQLTDAELQQIANISSKLLSPQPQALNDGEKALIDKVMALDNEYNKTAFAGLSNERKALDEWRIKNSNWITNWYQDEVANKLKPYITGQYIPIFAKKGAKIDSSIINNTMKLIQKDQENSKKINVEGAKLRLQKLEKELDRIHKTELLILKQIYK